MWSFADEPHEWPSRFFVWLVVWVIAAVGLLVFREPLARGVLVMLELFFLFGWVGEPGDWGLFCAQVALVLLLLSPSMDRFVRAGPPSPSLSPERASRQSITLSFGALVGALLVWAVVEVITGDAAAIPLLTLAGLFVILGRSTLKTYDSTEASEHP